MERASFPSLSSQYEADDANKENNPEPRLLMQLFTAQSEERRIKLQQFRTRGLEVEGIAPGISEFTTNPEIRRQILENITNYERETMAKAQENAKDVSKDAATKNPKAVQSLKKEESKTNSRQVVKVRTNKKSFKTPEEELKESIEYLQKLCNFQEDICNIMIEQV